MVPQLLEMLEKGSDENALIILGGLYLITGVKHAEDTLYPRMLLEWKDCITTFVLEAIINILKIVSAQNTDGICATLLDADAIQFIEHAADFSLTDNHDNLLGTILCNLALPDLFDSFVEHGGLKAAHKLVDVQIMQPSLLRGLLQKIKLPLSTAQSQTIAKSGGAQVILSMMKPLETDTFMLSNILRHIAYFAVTEIVECDGEQTLLEVAERADVATLLEIMKILWIITLRKRSRTMLGSSDVEVIRTAAEKYSSSQSTLKMISEAINFNLDLPGTLPSYLATTKLVFYR